MKHHQRAHAQLTDELWDWAAGGAAVARPQPLSTPRPASPRARSPAPSARTEETPPAREREAAIETDPAEDLETRAFFHADPSRLAAPEQEELWPAEIAALDAWIERRWRRRVVKTVAYLALTAVVGGAMAIAYTRSGSDAMASWMTMGHANETRAHVGKVLGRR